MGPGPGERKSWALLAVLLLADRPLTGRSLAALLFPDAADPLGALRWTLSQLRTGLCGQLTVEGIAGRGSRAHGSRSRYAAASQSSRLDLKLVA